MAKEDWADRQVAGVKAKRSLHYGDSKGSNKSEAEKIPVILLVSPEYKRVQMELKEILTKGGKHIASDGVELYRQAQNRLSGDLKGKVIGLVITDKPDDCYAPTKLDFPMWKETVLKYQDDYIENWIQQIAADMYPSTLTVITYFRRSKGQLSDEEIENLEDEFEALQQENKIKYRPCQTQEEVEKVVDKDLIGMALKQQQQKDRMKSFMRGRNQLLQKAQKLTKDARKKM